MVIDAVVDAKAVFDAIAGADACNPMECSLKLHLLSLRDKLAQGILKRLFWSDTRDMVADGMTKGAVERKEIHTTMNGDVINNHEMKLWKPKQPLGVPGSITALGTDHEPDDPDEVISGMTRQQT